MPVKQFSSLARLEMVKEVLRVVAGLEEGEQIKVLGLAVRLVCPKAV